MRIALQRLGNWIGCAYLIVFGAGILVIACLPIATVLSIFLNDFVGLATWRDKTTPLRPEVVQDICLKFGIPPSDSRCQKGAIVYAPDFAGTIRRAFPNEGVNQATFDQVQEKLGPYRVKCEPTVKTADGLEYFVCDYDLRGDTAYPIGMFFYSDGRLFRLIADIID